MRFFKRFRKNEVHANRDETCAEVQCAEQQATTDALQDAFRGCLIGGAAGDALGYTVEFMSAPAIFDRYGAEGTTEYTPDPSSGKALISDDTQMTLFTANGLLVGDTRGRMRGVQGRPREYVASAYQDWLHTQYKSYEQREQREGEASSWLCDVPELYACRAPGNTCLIALKDISYSGYTGDGIAQPKNNSKGCGGVMRVAPVALNARVPVEELDMEAAQIAAITHGHSLGYMPAAVLCHMINRIVFSGEQTVSLKEIVIEAKETVKCLFEDDAHLEELTSIIDRAIELSENDATDLENINRLGEGWVAEETLAIAVYCSLKYENDFSKGIIAAVNHGGDSDSTGAVTGNILGALIGYDAIEAKWKNHLECGDVLLEIADDLCRSCQMHEYSAYHDATWERKYEQMHRKQQADTTA